MPRQIRVNLDTERADDLIARVQGMEGVMSISVFRGVSLQPPGDEVAILTTVDASRNVYAILSEERFARHASVNSSELRNLYSSSEDGWPLEREDREPAWEETGFLLRRETNPRFNFFLLMVFSGAIAAVGLWQDALHVVVGAMVIAPGYEPILRISYGALPGPRTHIAQGLRSTLGGYACMAGAAALLYFVLQAVSPSAEPLASREWVQFWTSFTAASFIVAILAGLGGTLAVLADRPVLTAGAMIALALVPGMTIAGMALAAGDLDLAGRGLLRWGVDAVTVLATGGLLIWAKQRTVHQRRSLDRERRTKSKRPA